MKSSASEPGLTHNQNHFRTMQNLFKKYRGRKETLTNVKKLANSSLLRDLPQKVYVYFVKERICLLSILAQIQEALESVVSYKHFRLTGIALSPGHRKRHVMSFPVDIDRAKLFKMAVLQQCVRVMSEEKDSSTVSDSCVDNLVLAQEIFGKNNSKWISSRNKFRTQNFIQKFIRKFVVMHHSYRHTQGDLRFQPIFMLNSLPRGKTLMSNTPSPSRRVLSALAYGLDG